uniref:Uncharacterized protein n=1 Tax=Rhizophora mucronata TaxID=61149 RepID=A0A2P2NM05_RHIMU
MRLGSYTSLYLHKMQWGHSFPEDTVSFEIQLRRDDTSTNLLNSSTERFIWSNRGKGNSRSRCPMHYNCWKNMVQPADFQALITSSSNPYSLHIAP